MPAYSTSKLQRSAEGEVILVQDTGALWGNPSWANGYLWANGCTQADGCLWANGYLWANLVVDNVSPLMADGALDAALGDD